MRVLHVIQTMAPHEGGPPRVVAGLTVAQRAMGMDPHVLSGDADDSAGIADYWRAHVPGFDAIPMHAPGAGSVLRRIASLRRWLDEHLSHYSAVHVHQLWRLVPTMAARACLRTATPFVIAPHTSLSPWALSQKYLKKKIARVLVWDRIFQRTAGFHALNDLEAAEIREFLGAKGPPVHVVPNGVSLDEFSKAPIRRPSPALGVLLSGDRPRPFILFLARLHLMKGPDLLLEAFASLTEEFGELQLALAGPDYGMLEPLKRRVNELKIADRVRFLGLVSGEDRLWLLQNACCLSQPSRDEGFSLSILEALAASCPVVISRHCKFPAVASSGAGRIVDLSIPDIAAALRDLVGDPERRANAGAAGRSLVEREYTWEQVAVRTARMYESARGRVTGSPS